MSESRKHKILVVDDERANINVLTYLLKPKYTVYVAKDGQSALNVARSNYPDLILLDIMMPGMSGFEVISELKASEATKQIPVIFITGRDNIDDEETGLSLGAVDYITKPFHNSIVLARVKTHLKIVEYIRTIEHISMIDALTELPNRRSFDNRLNWEWGRSIREKQPLCLLMIDIDQFKRYNDQYGHKQGDCLLQALSRVLKQSLKRSGDFVSRWGGEEFAVLLPNTDLTGALLLAENIRANVENMEITGNAVNTRTTVSIGVNVITPTTEDSIDEFFSLSDKVLYAAKEAGRNRVCSVNDLK